MNIKIDDNVKRFILFYIWLGIITFIQINTYFENLKPPIVNISLSIPAQKKLQNEYHETIHKIHTIYKTPLPIAAKIVKTVYRHADDYTFPQAKLVLGVIATESSFNHRAVSYVGAKGLMQIMERWHGPVYGIEDNIQKGIQILKEYRERTQDDIRALEAYNMGITAVLRGATNKRFVRKIIEHRRMFV